MAVTNHFNTKFFLKLFLLSVILNLIWGLIATPIEVWRDQDKGFLTGLGYLTIYGATFFLCLEKVNRHLASFFQLVFLFMGIFVISSFIVGPSMTYFDSKFNSQIIAVTASTLFSSVCILFVVSKYFKIRYKLITGIAVFLVALTISFIVPDILNEPKYFDMRIFQSQSVFYSTWQILTTTILGIGISLK